MPEPDDIVLLKEFAASGSDAAFDTLVERYVNLAASAVSFPSRKAGITVKSRRVC